MKIFCVGFHKTGTKSLSHALKILGFNVVSIRHDLLKHILEKNFKRIFDEVDKFDAFEDNPWPLIYKELDKHYPNSKFILTIRDNYKWINSVVKYFGENETNMRKYIYGIGHPLGNEEIYLKKYIKHNEEVMDYFRNRTDDLLIVNWENGDGWNELCDFLKIPTPNFPFPHINKRSLT